MNEIYSVACTIPQAKTQENKMIQYDVLIKEIGRHLNRGNDLYVQEAVQDALNNGKIAIANLIDDVAQETLGTIFDHQEQFALRSDFFAIPIITQNSEAKTKVPSLGDIEKFLNKKMLDLNLIPEKAEVILAPILVSQKMSTEMPLSKWFELHKNILFKSENRHLKPIFQHPFYINSPDNIPAVHFIVGIVKQKSITFEFEKPNVFSNEFYVDQDKDKFKQEFVPFMSSKAGEAIVITTTPDFKMNALFLGYIAHQELLADVFIAEYATQEQIEFGVLSIDILNTFVILAWNKLSNKVVNYLLVEPFSQSMEESVDRMMDKLALTDKNVYVGNTIISYKEVEDYSRYNFQKYLDEEGATILHGEDIDD